MSTITRYWTPKDNPLPREMGGSGEKDSRSSRYIRHFAREETRSAWMYPRWSGLQNLSKMWRRSIRAIWRCRGFILLVPRIRKKRMVYVPLSESGKVIMADSFFLNRAGPDKAR